MLTQKKNIDNKETLDTRATNWPAQGNAIVQDLYRLQYNRQNTYFTKEL